MRYPVLLTVFAVFLAGQAAVAQVSYNRVPDWFSIEDDDYGTGCSFGDVDNDALLDLAVSNGNDMLLAPNYVYINEDGVLPNQASWVSSDEKYSGHCELGSINDDWFCELMVSNYISSGWGPATVQIYMNTNGVLEDYPSWETEDSIYSFRGSFGDADGDGDLDLAVATGESYNNIFERNLIYYNDGGELQRTPGWRSADYDASYDVHWVDIDNDGDLDLAFQTSQGPIKIYYNFGDSIATYPGWQSADSDNGNSFDFADLNGDGFLDMGAANNSQLNGSGRFRIYISDNGVLPTTPDWQSGSTGYGSEAVFTDVDNDGDYDFICGRWWGLVYIYLNDNGSFNPNPDWTCDNQYSSVVENIVFADVDNGAQHFCFESFESDGQRTLFKLNHNWIQGVDRVTVDGHDLVPEEYCYHLADGWVSMSVIPQQSVCIYYRNSLSKDMAVSNWDRETYLFYNTNDDPPVMVDMIPDDPTFDIPAGGSFTFTGMLRNKTGRRISGDVWVMLDVPGYGIYGPIQRYNNVPLQPDQAVSISGIRQDIPGSAPLGTYRYIAYCGNYPSIAVDSTSFEFTVTSPVGSGADDWVCSNWFDADGPAMPAGYLVLNNYPNPFNSSTEIVYDISSAERVRIDIYNLAGRHVEKLFEGENQPGRHAITWDASRYASGLYYCRISAGTGSCTRKMTLIK